MKAIIRWPGGETVFEDCNLGDPRIAKETERLNKAGCNSVRIVFRKMSSEADCFYPHNFPPDFNVTSAAFLVAKRRLELHRALEHAVPHSTSSADMVTRLIDALIDAKIREFAEGSL